MRVPPRSSESDSAQHLQFAIVLANQRASYLFSTCTIRDVLSVLCTSTSANLVDLQNS